MRFNRKKVLLELFVDLVWSDAIKIVIVTYIMVSSATTNIASFLLYCYFFFCTNSIVLEQTHLL